MASLSEENYLKAIYHLSRNEKEKITPTAIANEVTVNAASVIDMIKKLTAKKLISYDKKKGVKLTSEGLKLALKIVRNHRLWEVFLSEKLEYSWDVVHEIAEQLEHVKHEELADRLDKFLGFPEYDPHGDPIPKANGEIPVLATRLLSEIPSGSTCKVASIKDSSSVFLQYLEQLKISIGTKIKVIEKIPFDDSMNIQLGNSAITNVSSKLTTSIIVI